MTTPDTRYVNVDNLLAVLDGQDGEDTLYEEAYQIPDGDAVLLYLEDHVDGSSWFVRFQLTEAGDPSFKVAYTEESGEIMVELTPFGVTA